MWNRLDTPWALEPNKKKLKRSLSPDFMSCCKAQTAQVTAEPAESPPSGEDNPPDHGMSVRDLVDGYDSAEDDPWTNWLLVKVASSSSIIIIIIIIIDKPIAVCPLLCCLCMYWGWIAETLTNWWVGISWRLHLGEPCCRWPILRTTQCWWCPGLGSHNIADKIKHDVQLAFSAWMLQHHW